MNLSLKGRNIAHLRQIQKKLYRVLNNRFIVTHLASRIYQLNRVHKMTTTVALITACILILAAGACTLYESISEKTIAFFTMQLLHDLIQYVTL